MEENSNIFEQHEEEVPNSYIEYHDNGVIKLEKLKVTEKFFKHVHYDLRGQITKIVDYDDLGKVLNTVELTKETAKNGLSFTYYDNGNVQSLKYFINGKINYVEKIFDNDGQLLEVITYNKGIKSGPHTIYSKRNAKLSEVHYSENKPDGKAKYYYETGELKAEVHFQGGQKNGLSKYFHKNGNLRKKESMKNGIRNGEYSIYYENGAIKEKQNFQDGILTNEVVKYSLDGEIISKKYYDMGKEVAEPPAELEKEKVQPDTKRRVAPYARQRQIPVEQLDKKPGEPVKKEEEPVPVAVEYAHEPVKQPSKKVLSKEEMRRIKVKMAVNYSMVFIGALITIYIIYNLIIYFL